MSCKARLLSPRITLKKAKIFCCGNPNIGWPYTDAHKTSYKYHLILMYEVYIHNNLYVPCQKINLQALDSA